MSIGKITEEQVQRCIRALPSIAEIDKILARLRSELPPDLYYHNGEHTADVLHEVVLFALSDQRSQKEINLLAIAAAFHDAGFFTQRSENESFGAALARAAMQRLKHGEEEIALVERMILDTRLQPVDAGFGQVSTVPLSGYLLDADLSNLGRSDFFKQGELYRREIAQEQVPFMQFAVKVMEAHRWNTEAARQLRQAQKDANLAALYERVQQRSAQVKK